MNLDIEYLLGKQEDIVGNGADKGFLELTEERRDLASIELDSVFASTLVRISGTHGATLARDIAKGLPEVTDKKKLYLEQERKVAAYKRQEKLLQNKYDAAKLKERIHNKMGGL